MESLMEYIKSGAAAAANRTAKKTHRPNPPPTDRDTGECEPKTQANKNNRTHYTRACTPKRSTYMSISR